MRGGLLEGGALTLNRRTGRGPGGSSPKVAWPRCLVYVEDSSLARWGRGRLVNSGGAAAIEFF
jgi:hypothetical protein